MRTTLRTALLALATALAVTQLHAQYTPPPPPRPFPGFLNEKLRASDPYMTAWDIGVNVRERLEVKDNAGFTYAGQNADFRDTGNGLNNDNNNSYPLTRIMPRIGYTAKW